MALALSIGLLISSCKKTEVVPYDEEQKNHIVSYTVTNAQEILNGVVDDIDNTITVYMPYYISTDFIVPEIKLEEGATLIDAQGNSIDIREDLEPVPFDTVGYTYSVKDNANNIRKYTLVTKILPHVSPLKLGYSSFYNDNGVLETDNTTPKDAIINSRFRIYGNLESSAKNAKLTLFNKTTKAAIPNGLKLQEVGRSNETHYIVADISPDIQSGDYYIEVEHQGRKATLPTITMNYKLPYFGTLPKAVTQGETVTLPVYGPHDAGEMYSGVNTGIKRVYAIMTKAWLPKIPANFPEELFGKVIEIDIISQSRTEIKIKFPEVVPAGFYDLNASMGSGQDGFVIGYSGFAFYFDFEDTAFGTGKLRASIPYVNFEVKAKQ